MKRTAAGLVAREKLVVTAILAGLTLFYGATTVPSIADHPIIGGDEGWIISASEKLAEDGTFGSDLFAGFYGADEHYYFNLPLYHLALAGAFKIAGVGITQARLASAFIGLVLLGLTYLLGRRIGGLWVGAGAAALLVLLRLNLAPFTGLTLTDLGATVRYDLAAVPFAVGAVLAILRRPEEPRPRTAALAGLVLGLGCLVQFIAALLVVPLALFLLTLSAPMRERLTLVAVFGLAVASPLVPYLVYAAQDWNDFRGQSRTVEQRSDFLSPDFYLDNLTGEPDRYDLALDIDAPDSIAELVERPSARLALLVVAPLAFAGTAVRARRGSAPHRLLALVLAALVVEFALFESTKRWVYWVVAVPFLCVAVATLVASVAAWRPARSAPRRVALVATCAAAALFALEGIAVGGENVRDAQSASDYAAVGDSVMLVVPAGSKVLTDNRMWLTLEDVEARSLLLLFYWTNAEISEDQATDVEGAMRRIDAGYLLLSPLTREILSKLTPEDSARFERYLDEHGQLVVTVSGPPYGPIEVYELRP